MDPAKATMHAPDILRPIIAGHMSLKGEHGSCMYTDDIGVLLPGSAGLWFRG